MGGGVVDRPIVGQNVISQIVNFCMVLEFRLFEKNDTVSYNLEI